MSQSTTQDEKNISISRKKVGWITLACWMGALFFFLYHRDATTIYSGFIRVGLLMTAFWISLPSNKQEAAWKGISMMTAYAWAFVLLAIFLKVPFHLILLVLGLWWFFHYISKPFTDALKSGDEGNE